MIVNSTFKLGVITIAALLSFNIFADTTMQKAGKSIAEVASDTAITTKIKAKLALEADIPLNISVSTTDGDVVISGTVDTGLQANKIIDIASSVEGVKDINDAQLHVTSSENFFSDAAVTTKAKFKIIELAEQDQIGNNTNLHVETTNGDVHVFGAVTKKDDVTTIKNALSKIEGVKSVKVNINVVKD